MLAMIADNYSPLFSNPQGLIEAVTRVTGLINIGYQALQRGEKEML